MKARLLPYLLSCTLAVSTFATAKDIAYSVDGNLYQGYWASTHNKAPLVLLIHDWDGLTQYEIKRARMLQQMGYNVFAADLFGKNIRPTKLEDKRQHTGELYKNRQKLQKLISVSLAKAQTLGANTDKVILMGYCFGGAAVLEAARAGIKAKGFVSFHGGLQTPKNQNYAKTTAPILILHGTADSLISMSEFAKLAIELERDQVSHEMITYSGARHAFTVFGSPAYQATADDKSWQAFTRFLRMQTKG